MDSRIALLGSGLALGLLTAGCGQMGGADIRGPSDSLPPCNMKSLRASLASAKPGSTVRMGACLATGTLTVPAGVALAGAGPTRSAITAPAGRAAVELLPGPTSTQPTTLSGVAVSSTSGGAGVLAQGEGHVALLDVAVTAHQGIGIGVEGVSELLLMAVTLEGAITDPGSAGEASEESTPGTIATHGLVLVDVKSASLQKVSTRGFAGFGALLVRSRVVWTGGGAIGNAGTGLFAVGGETIGSGVELSGTLRGGFRVPAFGGVFVSEEAVLEDPALETQGPVVSLDGGKVVDNEGVGLFFADGKTAAPEPSLVLASIEEIGRNMFAGLIVADTAGVKVTDVRLAGTVQATMPLGDQDTMITAGDGVQLVRSTERIELTNVVSTENARGGLLLDTGAVLPEQGDFQWTQVNVHGNTGFGAVCQGAEAVWPPGATPGDPLSQSGWDLGIDRGDAATVESDAAWTNPLERIGAVAPCFFPSPVLVVEGGLSALLAR